MPVPTRGYGPTDWGVCLPLLQPKSANLSGPDGWKTQPVAPRDPKRCRESPVLGIRLGLLLPKPLKRNIHQPPGTPPMQGEGSQVISSHLMSADHIEKLQIIFQHFM
jgi:hypothetical protein